MQIKKLIKESPFLPINMILDTRNLENEQANKQILKQILAESEVINSGAIVYNETSLNHTRVKRRDNKYGDLLLEKNKIVAYIEFIPYNRKCKITTIWNSKKFIGLVEWYIYNITLKEYDAIISDNVFSKQGKRFFYKLLIKLKQKGYKIGIFDEGKYNNYDEKYIKDIDINEYEKYFSLKDMDNVFIISRNNFDDIVEHYIKTLT